MGRDIQYWIVISSKCTFCRAAFKKLFKRSSERIGATGEDITSKQVALSSIEKVGYKAQCLTKIQTIEKSVINYSCIAEVINDSRAILVTEWTYIPS